MSLWQSGICTGMVLAAALSDIRSRRIANRLIVTALAAGAVAILLLGDKADPQALRALAGLLAGLALLLPFYLLKWMGAGDVKLLAAIGFLLGPSAVLPVWLISCVTLTAHGLALLIFKWANKKPAFWYVEKASAALFGRGGITTAADQSRPANRGMPYGAHLAVATLIFLIRGEWHGV